MLPAMSSASLFCTRSSPSSGGRLNCRHPPSSSRLPSATSPSPPAPRGEPNAVGAAVSPPVGTACAGFRRGAAPPRFFLCGLRAGGGEMSAEAAGCPRTACVVVGVDRGGAGAIGTGRGGSDATTDASKSSVGTTPAAHSSRQAYIFAATGLFRTAERLRSSASFNATYSVSTASRPLTPAGMRFLNGARSTSASFLNWFMACASAEAGRERGRRRGRFGQPGAFENATPRGALKVPGPGRDAP